MTVKDWEKSPVIEDLASEIDRILFRDGDVDDVYQWTLKISSCTGKCAKVVLENKKSDLRQILLELGASAMIAAHNTTLNPSLFKSMLSPVDYPEVYIEGVLFDQLIAELERQDFTWGNDRELKGTLWITILSEEVGEVSQDILDKKWEDAERELVQVAAVVVQMLSDQKLMGNVE